jgi:hypothetical protein
LRYTYRRGFDNNLKMGILRSTKMNLQLTPKESEILKDALLRDIKNLEIESSRVDSIEYRKMLHERETILESISKKLALDKS